MKHEKLEAKDLRIGNLISTPTNKAHIIKEIFIRGEDSDGDYLIDNWNISTIEPIPLTEEWLIKLGFEKTESIIMDSYTLLLPMIGSKVLSVNIEQGNQYMYIKDFETDDTKCEPRDLVCLRNSDSHGRFYVHQLQNLYFALTGEELTF